MPNENALNLEKLEKEERSAAPAMEAVMPASESESNKTKAPLLRKRDYLSNEVELFLHTKAVRYLCLGYDDVDKVGLLRFAQFTHVLWVAVKNDDPYAEWHLMQLYDQMTDLQEAIKKLEGQCQQRLSQLRGLTVGIYSHPDPFKLQLRFASPFSFMAACLLADLDYIERQFYTLRRLGIVLDGYPTVTGFIPKVRAVFKKPLQWPNTGITRKDLRENNAKAQQVRAIAGEVPPPILNKTVKFAFLPK